MNIIKKFFPLLLGIILGYIFYYFILMEIIAQQISYGFAYFFISILSLICSCVLFSCIIDIILNKRLKKIYLYILCVLYIFILFSSLFIRSHIERVFVLNPFESITDLFSSKQMVIQSLLNYIIFIPMGCFFKKLSFYKMLIISTIISILIELVQVFTMRGFFDTFDIILYIIGITTGYLLSHKLNFILYKK